MPPQDQQQQQKWFNLGGLGLGGGGGPASSPEHPSPGAIRKSATALLRTVPPPLTANDNNNNNNDTTGGGGSSNPPKRMILRDSSNNKLYAYYDTDDDTEDNINETLERTIQRRDKRIADLQTEIRHCQSELQRCARDDHALRRGLLESTHRHTVAVKLWRRTNAGLKARVQCFEQEATPEAAREIANLIRDAAPANKDSSYLIMLQDQLTKAMTKLEHLSTQTDIVLHKGEEVVESLREEMNEVLRERCRMELELLDQERMLEDDMRRMVVRTERRLRRVQGEIDYLEKTAMETLKEQEEEDDEGDVKDNEKGEEKVDVETTPYDQAISTNNVGGDLGGTNNDDDETNNEEVDKPNSEYSKKATITDNTMTTEEVTKNNLQQQQQQQQQHTPEILRKELRTLAMERDRTVSVLQKKLREKNEEYHALLQQRESRQASVSKLESEKKDREEWARVKKGDIP
jgi:hypothetical protein